MAKVHLQFRCTRPACKYRWTPVVRLPKCCPRCRKYTVMRVVLRTPAPPPPLAAATMLNVPADCAAQPQPPEEVAT